VNREERRGVVGERGSERGREGQGWWQTNALLIGSKRILVMSKKCPIYFCPVTFNAIFIYYLFSS